MSEWIDIATKGLRDITGLPLFAVERYVWVPVSCNQNTDKDTQKDRN